MSAPQTTPTAAQAVAGWFPHLDEPDRLLVQGLLLLGVGVGLSAVAIPVALGAGAATGIASTVTGLSAAFGVVGSVGVGVSGFVTATIGIAINALSKDDQAIVAQNVRYAMAVVEATHTWDPTTMLKREIGMPWWTGALLDVARTASPTGIVQKLAYNAVREVAKELDHQRVAPIPRREPLGAAVANQRSDSPRGFDKLLPELRWPKTVLGDRSVTSERARGDSGSRGGNTGSKGSRDGGRDGYIELHYRLK